MSEGSVVGVIESIAIKEGKAGNRDWKRTAARVNAEYYQTFDKDLGKQLVALEGENVAIEFEERERNGFMNLEVIAVKRSKMAPEAPVSSSNGTEPSGHTRSLKDVQIARSVALKAAAAAVSMTDYEELKDYVTAVGTVADTFYGWLIDTDPSRQGETDPFIGLEVQSSSILPKDL